MDEVRRERIQIATDRSRQPARHLVFAASRRQRQRRHRHQIAGRRKGRFGVGRRIDTHGHALRQQMADEQIQSLVRAIADIIIIAAEHGNAQIGGVHRRADNAARGFAPLNLRDGLRVEGIRSH
jgi:hypothetical protein